MTRTLTREEEESAHRAIREFRGSLGWDLIKGEYERMLDVAQRTALNPTASDRAVRVAQGESDAFTRAIRIFDDIDKRAIRREMRESRET